MAKEFNDSLVLDGYHRVNQAGANLRAQHGWEVDTAGTLTLLLWPRVCSSCPRELPGQAVVMDRREYTEVSPGPGVMQAYHFFITWQEIREIIEKHHRAFMAPFPLYKDFET